MKGRKPATIAAGSHPLVEVPRAPAWLSRDGKTEWRRLAPILVDRGVLTEADLGVLASCCAAFGVIVETSRILSRDGLVLVSPAGMAKQNPALGSQNAAMATHRQLASELGLSPVARSRTAIEARTSDDEPNPLDL